MRSHPAIPGRSLVTRRAITDLVRGAALGSYGVLGFEEGPLRKALAALGLARPGARVVMDGGISVELRVRIAYGTPIAEVARQVEAAVRYRLRQAIGREPDHVAIRVVGLRREGRPEAGLPARHQEGRSRPGGGASRAAGDPTGTP